MSARPDGPPSVLRDHALIADGERGAVLDPHRGIVWLCVPRWHDEPVFAGLIGGTGRFLIEPVDPWHVWGGAYVPGTLVWRGRWVTGDGLVEYDEALARPADQERVVVLHRLRAVEGDARLRAELQVGSGYAPVTHDHGAGSGAATATRTTAKDKHKDKHKGKHKGGTHGLQLGDDGIWSGTVGQVHVRLQGVKAATLDDEGALTMELALQQGEQHDIVLELARTSLPDDAPDPDRTWQETFASWERAVPELPGLRADDEVRQSYTVLAGLTSSDNGMVAAATMALPERARAGRNYDYRYAWIRDQCYVGQAVAALGPYPLLDSALTFVTDRILADGENLKPAYRVDGGPVPDEHHVGLPGYPGGGDTVGNWVNQQFQLDAFGEALCMYAAAAGHGLLQAPHWHAVHVCADVVAKRWKKPEAGIWELDETAGPTRGSPAWPACAPSPATSLPPRRRRG